MQTLVYTNTIKGVATKKASGNGALLFANFPTLIHSTEYSYTLIEQSAKKRFITIIEKIY